MTDQFTTETTSRPGIVVPDQLTAASSDEAEETTEEVTESVDQPAKVMRIGAMTKQLLDEVQRAPLDSASRQRLRAIYERSIKELSEGLSADLVAELDRLALPFASDEPSDAELRIAQAQLVGWLEGLFHGIQATLYAQQLAAQAQLDDMRRKSLPAGASAEAPRGAGPYL